MQNESHQLWNSGQPIGLLYKFLPGMAPDILEVLRGDLLATIDGLRYGDLTNDDTQGAVQISAVIREIERILLVHKNVEDGVLFQSVLDLMHKIDPQYRSEWRNVAVQFLLDCSEGPASTENSTKARKASLLIREIDSIDGAR